LRTSTHLCLVIETERLKESWTFPSLSPVNNPVFNLDIVLDRNTVQLYFEKELFLLTHSCKALVRAQVHEAASKSFIPRCLDRIAFDEDFPTIKIAKMKVFPL
jgi:hypothetical protein